MRWLVFLVLPIFAQDTIYFHDGQAIELVRSQKDNAFELEGLQPVGSQETFILELQRFQVFKPGSVITVNGENGVETFAPSQNHYFRGKILNDPLSVAFMSIHEDGSVFGMFHSGTRVWAFSDDRGILIAREASQEDREHMPGFSCKNDSANLENPNPKERKKRTASQARRGIGDGYYEVTIAVESDFEYFQKFGNTPDATDYIGDIIGYASATYLSELNTTLVVGSVNLWSTNTDPWTQSSSNCKLFEFGRYWNNNNSGISRTAAHFFSGTASNSGIAWVGVLCSGGFNYNISGQGCSLSPDSSNYGGAYGYTGGIDGNFDINNPQVIWDIVAVTHEIGHNFNSPHTHCYMNIGGSSQPIDQCYNGQSGQSGCYGGAQSLPGCSTGGGCGTIMSYCHLLSGGMSNLSFTFGRGWGFGVLPDRVPDRMLAEVEANNDPGCIPFIPGGGGGLFSDGFESGDTSLWDTTVPFAGAASVSVNGSAAIVGSFGMQVNFNSNDQAYVSKDFDTVSPIFRANASFDSNTYSSTDDNFRYLAFRENSTNVVSLHLRDNNGLYMRAEAFEDGGGSILSEWIPISDGTHQVSCELRQATGTSTNDGVLIVYLDGNFFTAINCLNNDTLDINSVAMGMINGTTGHSGAMYFDHYETFDDSILSFSANTYEWTDWPSTNVMEMVLANQQYTCANP